MDARRALMLQVEWGADEALAATPLRRLRAPAPSIGQPAARPAPDPEPERVTTTATRRGIAGPPERLPAFTTVEEWTAALARFDGAGLAATATHLVMPSGADRARPGGLFLVAEAPGEDEDRSGHAFVGREGQLVRRMLASIDVDAAGATLAYLAPWRPPGGRTPFDTEIAACLPFLRELVRLVKPGLLLALGSVPARALLGGGARRGRWGETIIAGLDAALPVLPTVNPAVLLKQPQQKSQAWADLRLLRRRMEAITSS